MIKLFSDNNQEIYASDILIINPPYQVMNKINSKEYSVQILIQNNKDWGILVYNVKWLSFIHIKSSSKT